jgi:hypothetical protein
MNNIIAFPSCRFSDRGVLYAGQVWRNPIAIRDSVPRKDFLRLVQRFLGRHSEIGRRWGGPEKVNAA